MARIDPDQPLQLSVFDRLLLDDPEQTVSGRRGRGQLLADLRRTVQRDLENLLNTRQRCRSWPSDLKELDQSLLNYGIPDYTSATLISDTQREAFRHAVEAAVKRFEPRFTSVTVTLVENQDSYDRTLRFRIEAFMQADPLPEHLVFDSQLDPASRGFLVSADR